MTLRSRSCVIGRGVEMFSICSAMALASKIPTQIGSTRCPSLSRRITIGMFVIGSTISPLIVISICMAPYNLGAATPLSRRPTHRRRPQTLCGPARSTRTGTVRPIHVGRPRQVDHDVLRSCGPRAPSRAAGSPRRRAPRPSRPTSRFVQRRSGSPAAAPAARRSAASSPPRAHRPAAACSASVFGRGEYLNENMLWYRTAAVSDSVSSKSASVSPGNPTIISVDSATSGSGSRICADQIEIALARVPAPHRRRARASSPTAPAGAGAGRSSGSRAIASRNRGETCRGCGLAKRIRSMPVDVVNRLEQPGEVARRVVGRLVVVDDLPEQLHFPAARSPPPRGPRPGCRPSAASARGPRVYGTTQKLQNSLHPSMIVTYALTGSLRRVTPSGNVTSSYGLRSIGRGRARALGGLARRASAGAGSPACRR